MEKMPKFVNDTNFADVFKWLFITIAAVKITEIIADKF